MQATPGYWQGHYHGTEAETFMQRHFGYADRIRYYWPLPAVREAVAALHDDLSAPIPEPLLLQGFAPEVLDRAEALTGTQVQRLIDATIQTALAPYFFGDPA
jgi:D-tagatose-1,6-bisphosphate aldolase subunit GatZ/KbaZ